MNDRLHDDRNMTGTIDRLRRLLKEAISSRDNLLDAFILKGRPDPDGPEWTRVRKARESEETTP